jgi:hypothetical protein
MTTSTKSEALTPLSESTNLAGFPAVLKYVPPGPGSLAAYALDLYALARLGEALRVSGCETLAEMGAQRVNGVVSRIEYDRFGEWTIEPGEGILGRLDQHFRPRQEAHAAYRREQDERLAAMAEASRKLDVEVAERADRAYRAVWGLPAAAI